MKHADAALLLRWAAPRLGLRGKGFVNVQGQVCKRIRQRARALGLASVAAYRERLEQDAEEWHVLSRLCFVTISRFYRDAPAWQALTTHVLPALADARRRAGGRTLRCWSAGCASGEEPYTLSIVWALEFAARYPEIELRVLGTDLDEIVLERAAQARYAAASLRELPAAWREQAFELEQGLFRLREAYRAPVELRRADLRLELPEPAFDLILCRNVVLTYFDAALQQRLLAEFGTRLRVGGALVIGRGEQLPPGAAREGAARDRAALSPWRPEQGIYRRGPP